MSLWHSGQAVRINPNHFPADVVPQGQAGSWQSPGELPCCRGPEAAQPLSPASPASLPKAQLLHPPVLKYPMPRLGCGASPGLAGHSTLAAAVLCPAAPHGCQQ